MRIHDFSEIKTTDGKLAFQDRLMGMLKYDFSWPQDVMAQETFLSAVKNDIDKRSTMLRNFPLPEVGVGIPLLLIGPGGVRVILLTRARGIFRAKEDQWLELSGKSFRPAKDNLIRRAQLYARAVQKFLGQKGFMDINVDSVIVGVHPGLHVDTQRPAVRVLQADAIRRFSTQWNQEEITLSADQIYQIISDISHDSQPDEDNLRPSQTGETRLEPRSDPFAQSLAPLQKTFSFSSKQWIVLGVLVAITVLVLLGFMMFIILTTI